MFISTCVLAWQTKRGLKCLHNKNLALIRKLAKSSIKKKQKKRRMELNKKRCSCSQEDIRSCPDPALFSIKHATTFHWCTLNAGRVYCALYQKHVGAWNPDDDSCDDAVLSCFWRSLPAAPPPQWLDAVAASHSVSERHRWVPAQAGGCFRLAKQPLIIGTAQCWM